MGTMLRLRARRERPRHRRAAKQRDEIAPFHLVELHSVPVPGQHIGLARISQEVTATRARPRQDW